MMQLSVSAYQFLPFRVMSQWGLLIFSTQYSTTLFVSILRFFLILSTPIGVVWILSMLSNNSCALTII